MKKTIAISLILISFFANAQKVRPYTGIAGYFYSGFDKSLFVSIDAGAEFKINQVLKPETDLSYYYGSTGNYTNYGSQGQLISIFSSYATSLNFNLCPKICIGNTNKNDRYLVILPKYTFSKVTAVGEYTTLNENDIKITSKEKITEYQHSLGFGIGIDFSISDNSTDSFSINIYYQNVDLGEVINQLNHFESNVNTKNTFGVGFNYYFGKKTIKLAPITKPEPLN